MKKLSLFFGTFLVLFIISCSGDSNYTMETFYSKDKSNGDTTMVGKESSFHAESDSIAYLTAQEKFDAMLGKQGGENDLPVKFTLRNKNGVIVANPAQKRENELMYPNQHP